MISRHYNPQLMLTVVLIGSIEDKRSFLKACNVDEQLSLKPSISEWNNQASLFFIEFFHGDIRFNISNKVTYDYLNYEAVADASVDALIYVNATLEQKRVYESIRDPEQCVAIDYQSQDFKDALNCLHNIPFPVGHDKFYNKKLMSVLNANAWDETSWLSLLPKEIVGVICEVYSRSCNKNILFFNQKQNMDITKSTIDRKKKIEEVNWYEAFDEQHYDAKDSKKMKRQNCSIQ